MITNKLILAGLITGFCGNWAKAIEYNFPDKSEEKSDKTTGFYLINKTPYKVQPAMIHFIKQPPYTTIQVEQYGFPR